MKLETVPILSAEGSVLAHTTHQGPVTLKKGCRLSADDLDRLALAGLREVTVARYEADDVPEDEAASRIAACLAGPGVRVAPPFTGRSNFHAGHHGLLVIDRAAIEGLNRIHEAVTLATLPPFAPVSPDQIVATAKIIPFAAPGGAVAAWERAARPLAVAPFVRHRVALVQTELPGLKPSMLDKTAWLTQERLAALGSELVVETRCPHDAAALAAALRRHAGTAELLLVCGASAIVDRQDVIPAAIVAAGGEIMHFGMPVDPGNLLLLARLAGAPVLGLPGCARSPKMNGLDWVLQRLLARLPIGREEITAMGVGGLLPDTISRGLPRETPARGSTASPMRVFAIEER